jgi:hypothetical protein
MGDRDTIGGSAGHQGSKETVAQLAGHALLIRAGPLRNAMDIGPLGVERHLKAAGQPTDKLFV